MKNIYKPNNKNNLLVPQSPTEVKITAQSTFDHLSSNIKESIFVWLYHITVDNYTANNIKLVSGRWEIFDKYGKAELEDKALINNPYIIKAEQSFEGTNIIRLFSDSGLIYGKYFFLNLETHEEFYVNIEAVSLDNIVEEKRWN
ncbi:ApaG domain [Candidatus Tisiphia endosymbiont of Beris chalybata]|uniref:ApaG domain-containing protein n=1 Tax=Candidatus Tisiphia endosymbiont of Beris chalybata TaxID=3066262 RepID=UPI00312CAF9C